MEAVAELRCPECGHAESLEMPADACVYFHVCAGCGTRIRPKPGDCCVFCSYGSAPCPPARDLAAECCGERPRRASGGGG